jgi:hypothetical protein
MKLSKERNCPRNLGVAAVGQEHGRTGATTMSGQGYHEPDTALRRRTLETVATFSVFMHSMETGDLKKAATAQAKLARLGVRVTVIGLLHARGGARHGR